MASDGESLFGQLRGGARVQNQEAWEAGWALFRSLEPGDDHPYRFISSSEV